VLYRLEHFGSLLKLVLGFIEPTLTLRVVASVCVLKSLLQNDCLVEVGQTLTPSAVSLIKAVLSVLKGRQDALKDWVIRRNVSLGSRPRNICRAAAGALDEVLHNLKRASEGLDTLHVGLKQAAALLHHVEVLQDYLVSDFELAPEQNID